MEQLKSLAPHEYYRDQEFQGINSLCMDETNIPENIKNKKIYWKRPHVSYDRPHTKDGGKLCFHRRLSINMG